MEIKVRALFVDTRLKEYTIGLPHDVTDRLFVVRRAYRLNTTCRRRRERRAGSGSGADG